MRPKRMRGSIARGIPRLRKKQKTADEGVAANAGESGEFAALGPGRAVRSTTSKGGPMAVSDHVDLPTFMEGVKKRNPHQPEFVQAVQEVAEDIFDFMADKEQYHAQQILRRIAEPDRVVSFRVCWEDDNGNIRVQRGWRVQTGACARGEEKGMTDLNELTKRVDAQDGNLVFKADIGAAIENENACQNKEALPQPRSYGAKARFGRRFDESLLVEVDLVGFTDAKKAAAASNTFVYDQAEVCRQNPFAEGCDVEAAK